MAEIDGKQIGVAVRDRGMGIPEKDLASIFGRYNRASNVSGIVGTGVGLYLVRIVAELHGGSVSVESTEGEGSCFLVRLPVSVPTAAAVSNQGPSPSNWSRGSSKLAHQLPATNAEFPSDD
ncbi:sensor histidine kinase [Bradyrhizobium tropiciagri]|nr:sensor histidine kinase [Bradyrhizobium tropiciagri]